MCAYALAPGGAVVRALETAADRGARVAVRLERHPTFGHAAPVGDARGVAVELAAHGVVVTTSAPGDPPGHLKAAIVDGRAFLDDRNWATNGPETIVCDDDVRDIAAIGVAIAGGAPLPPGTDLALEKNAALALEAEAIRAASGDRIDVATESFGGCAISAAIAARARAGTSVRLEVNARALEDDRSGRERSLVHHLAEAGVEIRAVANDEKFALLGDRLWVGSANATFTPGTMSDWGAIVCDHAIAAGLAATFARAWTTGCPVTG